MSRSGLGRHRAGKPIIAIIAAMAENRVIGRNNALPWHLPEDLKRFKRLTLGHAVIMGRRNYESIGRPLPGRRNIVVTRRPDYEAPGCVVVHSPAEALAAAEDDEEIFVIGGAELYAQFLPSAHRLYLTLVHAEVDGDTLFPAFDWSDWQETARETHPPDARHPYAYSFLVLERKNPLVPAG
jgi:dihydrofolate reductase